jgi:hypothetical protein
MTQLKLKTFQQISENWSRGDLVSRKSNPRHRGNIYQITRGNDGTKIAVKWHNGWKEHSINPKEINRAKPEFTADDEITQVKKWLKKGGKK